MRAKWTISDISFGRAFAMTEMTPSAPRERRGKVRASPEMTRKPAGRSEGVVAGDDAEAGGTVA